MGTMVVNCRRWAAAEFGRARLGDARLTKRLVRVAHAVAAKAGKSLPEAIGGWTELKAAYRLFDNEKATRERVVGPHLENTRRACASGGEHLLVEDTTALSYSGRRPVDGLGPISKDPDTQGILVHSTLALRVERWLDDGDPEVTAEGLFGQESWVRTGEKKKGTENSHQRKERSRESERWARVLQETGGPPDGCRWTLLADREGDIYRVMSDCRGNRVDFIIRALQPRCLMDEDASPFDAVAATAPLGRLTVDLRARPGALARTAILDVRAVRVTLRAPKGERSTFDPLPVSVVEAREVDAPAGVEPLRWVLLTSWNVATLEDAVRVVKAYSKRWLIEEYHKALKTGAGIERSQLEARERLEVLLGILAVVAVRLLNMKLLCRSRPHDEAAAGTLGPEALKILEATYGTPRDGWTNRNLFVAVARLGGFLARKGDGDPGWITIWRGFDSLMLMARGFDILQG